MILKSDFIDWKNHPVTKAVFTSISERIYQLQVELGNSAGENTRQDAIKVGAIQACKDFLEVDVDVVGGSE